MLYAVGAVCAVGCIVPSHLCLVSAIIGEGLSLDMEIAGAHPDFKAKKATGVTHATP